jgi:hypothetical protein
MIVWTAVRLNLALNSAAKEFRGASRDEATADIIGYPCIPPA